MNKKQKKRMAELEQQLQKGRGPLYKFTAQYMQVSFICAWVIIFALVFGGLLGSDKADSLADIIVPAMVALIVTLLGVHRAFGSLDYRTDRSKRDI